MNDYPSEICEYCPYTEYGEYPCGSSTPNGYISCEGIDCDEAYKNYKEENQEDDRTLEEMF